MTRGYTSVNAIASTPYHVFAQALEGAISQRDGERLYASAQMQQTMLNTAIAGLLENQTSSADEPTEIDQPDLAVSQTEPCETIASPNAYLDALLNFATLNLLNQDRPIDRTWLETTFCQPFGQLVGDCRASEVQLYQVRICIEVLRTYLHSTLVPLSYLERSYQDLLTGNGTSYDELQRALHADDKKRQELADRLGIALGHLNELFLPAAQITESKLADNYLILIAQTLTDPNGTLLADEWAAVYAILTQVWKRKRFVTWRAEEKEKAIILAPAFFKLAEPNPLVFPQPMPFQPRTWLGTIEARLTWLNTLRSRIDQPAQVTDALEASVTFCENTNLPALRNALILTIQDPDSGNNLDSKSAWFTNNFQIDASLIGIQLTTRVGQALETLQGILWAVRTGDLSITHPDLTLVSLVDFDDAWPWIGSFASWRSSQMVLYYPENFLSPGLRAHQTAAFQEVVNATRSAPAFSPQQARESAFGYATYLQDVCTLSLSAACQARTRVAPNGDPHGSFRDLYYMFGIGGASRALYWSAFDAQVKAPADYAQSFWSKVPGINNVIDIVGAVPYEIDTTLRSLLLFVTVSLNGARTLVVTKYDLEKRVWDTGAASIESPKKSGDFSVILEQNFFASTFPLPSLVARLGDGTLYRATTTGDGTVLSQQGWTEWRPNTAIAGNMAIHAFILLSDTDWRLITQPVNGKIRVIGPSGSTGEATGRFLGTLNFTPTEVFLIYRDNSPSTKTARYALIDRLGNTATFQAPTLPERIAINCGAGASSSLHACWYAIDGTNANKIYRATHCQVSVSNELIQITDLLPAAPALKGPFQITDVLSEDELQQRAQEIDQAFAENQGSPLSVLNYLEEAYYFVPLQLMTQLQRSGEYITCLDWLRTVYDYTRPLSKAMIYVGMRPHIQAQQRYQRFMDLLQDPLDAYRLASTRPVALVRFALQNGISCFLDYADSEFSRDTSESVPRARNLYINASRLLDILKQIKKQEDKGQRLRRQRHAWRIEQNDYSSRDLTEMQHDMLLREPEFADLAEKIGKMEPISGTRRIILSNLFQITPLLEVPPNPVIQTLYLHMAVNLYKIRNSCNIAGMVRQLDPYAVPLELGSGYPLIGAPGELPVPGARQPAPTLYRYSVLIERAKQEVNLAIQVENAMLSALEKRDAEYYTLMRARQDLGLAQANVQLQDLRVREAQNNVVLAQFSQQRAQTQESYYQARLNEGVSQLEKESLVFMEVSVGLQAASAATNFLAAALPAAISAGFPSGVSVSVSPQGAAQSIASGFASLAGVASTQGSVLSTMASYERRQQEWELQKNLSSQDVLIGAQQITTAQDHVRIVGQDRNIASLQASNASINVEYLANKFTNATLYDWMSQVLEGVYRSILQQSTAAAQVAAAQLAFERQETPPVIIKTDYWEMSSGSGTEQERKGLTGSYRLLEDINSLDEYAFSSAKRKLQLTKTISLSRLAPAEFQRLKTSGVMQFATPMEMFDRDFPGHYLRLINRVRVSVIALIPATESIKATLATSGVSRVVIGSNDQFRSLVINRQPEQTALTSPRDASGIFELHAIQPEMLLPFENTGVDTSWIFSIPQAANLFDYNTIADVLLTIEYTALASNTYRTQVCRSLATSSSAERPFSFRQELPDQWYDLHNPGQTETPLTVRFSTKLADFPLGLKNLRISQVALYFKRASGQTFEVEVKRLLFTEGTKEPVGGGATSIDGVISTRRGNASSWVPLIGLLPAGSWELALPDTAEVRRLFSAGLIEDILFDISYTYQTPDWIF